MAQLVESFLDSVDSFLAWLSSSLKQTTESYCDLETADSPTVLVGHDGALMSVLKIQGATGLIGPDEFTRLQEGLNLSLQNIMSRTGYAMQVFYNYDGERIQSMIEEVFKPAKETARKLNLDLEDLFKERINFLARYCAEERVYCVLWTLPSSLTSEQFKRARKDKLKQIRDKNIPAFKTTQNVMAAIPDLRESHDAFVRGTVNDLSSLNVSVELLEVHDAIHAMRTSADPNFTDRDWRASLPGDQLYSREINQFKGDVSDVLWPSLARQIIPRDSEDLDLRTCRIGDLIYSTIYIDLFPKDIKTFSTLFRRTLQAKLPWRISFLIESEGLDTLRFKGTLAAILSFSSAQNRLISDSANLLRYIKTNTDDSVIKLRVAACTWAPENDIRLLRRRTSELSKAIQGWGSCDVSEISGDPFAGIASTMLGLTLNSVANPSVAPLSDVLLMIPFTRPASPWEHGALFFRTPDGKPWPYQPGSSEQTTWIDLIYARPGSGKSVLSNAINLALCLNGGLQRLPRIAIVDIGPSSSGLISLLKEALPPARRHEVAYHRLRMTPEFSINPFDTQLGCRFPTAQERAFLVNFLTLIATPLGADKPYDGISDLVGMVVDEIYKRLSDSVKPHTYAPGIDLMVDGILEEINFVKDSKTTWWEVTDALFVSGFTHEAQLAQRYATPLLADAASICRIPAIEDLYGKIIAPTGETLINAFARMISASVLQSILLRNLTGIMKLTNAWLL